MEKRIVKDSARKKEEIKNESSLKLIEMIKKSEKEPTPEIIWRGITKGSFGFIFGPSKSGKTIFCENLAMKLAIGSESFLGDRLIKSNQKVLFISLEEFWLSRARRNAKQILELDNAAKSLIESNFLTAPTDFLRYIDDGADWRRLGNLIQNSSPDVVIIDSLTRLASNIEESETSKRVSQKLREITYSLGITMIVIHHSTKIGDKPISRDDMAGSRVLAQEADFAIAISRTPMNDRYIKNIFFRYADDYSETVSSFKINSSLWIDSIEEINEYKLYNKMDGRVDTTNSDKIVEYLSQNSCTTSAELEKVFVESQSMSRRTMFNHLRQLTSKAIIEKTNNDYCLVKS